MVGPLTAWPTMGAAYLGNTSTAKQTFKTLKKQTTCNLFGPTIV